MTLIRPLESATAPAMKTSLTLRNSARVPWLLGFAIFVCSVGYAIPVPNSFYLQAVLCPMIVAGAYLLAMRDLDLGSLRIEPTLLLLCTWSIVSVSWTIAGTRSGLTACILLVAVIATTYFGTGLVEPMALVRWLTASGR